MRAGVRRVAEVQERRLPASPSLAIGSVRRQVQTVPALRPSKFELPLPPPGIVPRARDLAEVRDAGGQRFSQFVLGVAPGFAETSIREARFDGLGPRLAREFKCLLRSRP